MKKNVILFIGICLLAFLGCDQTEPDPDHTCTDGIMNGNETGVDCGGDCQPCFDCTTTFCFFLSGGLSNEPTQNKKWECINMDDNATLHFYSSGVAFEAVAGESASGTWVFDNPGQPAFINITYNSKPDYWPPVFVIDVKMLTVDTLKVNDRVYIPISTP